MKKYGFFFGMLLVGIIGCTVTKTTSAPPGVYVIGKGQQEDVIAALRLIYIQLGLEGSEGFNLVTLKKSKNEVKFTHQTKGSVTGVQPGKIFSILAPVVNMSRNQKVTIREVRAFQKELRKRIIQAILKSDGIPKDDINLTAQVYMKAVPGTNIVEIVKIEILEEQESECSRWIAPMFGEVKRFQPNVEAEVVQVQP